MLLTLRVGALLVSVTALVARTDGQSDDDTDGKSQGKADENTLLPE